MAIQFRVTVPKEIEENGIYLVDFQVSCGLIKKKEEMLFSFYQQELTVKKFFEKHNLASFGIKKGVSKVLSIELKIISYHGTVKNDSFEKWKTSKVNTNNISTILQRITSSGLTL